VARSQIVNFSADSSQRMDSCSPPAADCATRNTYKDCGTGRLVHTSSVGQPMTRAL